MTFHYYMYIVYSTSSVLVGIFGLLCFFTIINNASVNISVLAFFYTIVCFTLGKCPEVKLLEMYQMCPGYKRFTF